MSGGKKTVEIVSQSEVFCPVVKFNNSTIKTTITQEVTQDIPRENKQPSVLIKVAQETNNALTRGRSIFKKNLSILTTVIISLIVVLAVGLVGLRLSGFRTFTVMSGSMEPEYPVGALIFVKPVNYYELEVGDVISYVANDEKIVVTHRIVDIEVDEKDANVWRFRTQGDANNTPDGKLVHYKNILGTPIISIPYIGYFVHNVQQPPGIYIALVVGTLLLAWTFLPGTLEERRKTARKSVA